MSIEDYRGRIAPHLRDRGSTSIGCGQQAQQQSEGHSGHHVRQPDQNYFARRFKAYFGLSETTYRTRFAHTVKELKSWP